MNNMPDPSSPMDVSYNNGFSNSRGEVNALQIRLNCSPIIEDIELFLRGARIELFVDEKTGKTKSRVVPIGAGSSKANPSGIQGILSYVSSVINTQVVQGNYDAWRYENAIVTIRIELAGNLINNCYNWDIKEDDLDIIIDTIMNIVEPFLSRLVDNKERDSYSQTIKHNEVNTLRDMTAKTGTFPFNVFGGNSN